MAIEISKPQPIRLGDRYLYTLTSYAPVEVEVTMELVTEEDIDLTLESLADEAGVALADVDDEWVRAHAVGAGTVAELRERIREDRLQQARRLAERDKQERASEALAERLGQALPADEVARYRAMLLRSNELDAGRMGLALDDLLARSGLSRSAFDATLDQEAEVMASREAAFSAFASERKLKVDDSEIPFLLGLSAAETRELLESARRSGGFEDLRRQCLITKASHVVAAECTCAYREETPEEAHERGQRLRDAFERIKVLRETSPAPGSEGGKGGSPAGGPDLKLV